MLENRWRHGKVCVELPPVPVVLGPSGGIIWPATGLEPTELVLDKAIGSEIVLLIIESAPHAQEFEGRNITGLQVRTGLVVTSYGPVFFLLLQFPDPVTGESIVYEKLLNPKNDEHLRIFEQLASQTHLHVLIADQERNVINAFEFPNRYGLIDVMPKLRMACAEMIVLDFKLAKAEFENTCAIDELLQS